MVDLEHVLLRLIAEKDLSLIEFVDGFTRIRFKMVSTVGVKKKVYVL